MCTYEDLEPVWTVTGPAEIPEIDPVKFGLLCELEDLTGRVYEFIEMEDN